MRIVLLASLLALQACSPTRPTAIPPPDPGIAARVDSLLSVPPDSLSQADTAWLAAYAARQSTPEARRPALAKAEFAAAVAAVTVGVFAYFVVKNLREQ